MNPALLEPARWAAEDVHFANELLSAATREGRALEARRDSVRELLRATKERTSTLLEHARVAPEELEGARAKLDADPDFQAWLPAHMAAHLKDVPVPDVTPPPNTPSPAKSARLLQGGTPSSPLTGQTRPGQEALQFGWITVGVVLPLLPFLPFKAGVLLAAIAVGIAAVTSAIALTKGRRRGALTLALAGVVAPPLLVVAGPVIRSMLVGWLS